VYEDRRFDPDERVFKFAVKVSEAVQTAGLATDHSPW